MKICFVTEDFYPNFIGGQGIYGFNLVSNLARLGHKVTILAEGRGSRGIFWQEKKNIRLLLTPFCFGNQILLAFFEYLFFFVNCRDEKFDILHANQMSGLFFVLFKPKNVGKVVVSAHNTNFDMAKKTDSLIKKILYQPLIFLERIVYQKAEGILFNSPDEEIELKNYYKIKKLTKSVYLGVDIPKFKKFDKKNLKMDLGIPADNKIVLYVGRLVKRKKVDILLKALEKLEKMGKKVHGLIVGNGAEKENLERIAPPNVTFLGYVENTTPYFSVADLFVTVSVAEGGFLLSALEGASFGLPLILSQSAAGFPIIKEGRNGYILKSDDVNILANKIVDALGKSSQMGKISMSIAKKFSWNICARETLKLYKAVIQNPQKSPGINMRGILTGISISFVILIISLILLEIFARYFKLFPNYDYPRWLFQEDELLAYSMVPNFDGEFVKQEFTTHITTNSLGLRDYELGDKKDNEFRIMALGDSFTWGGYGVELQNTFTKVFEQRLNQMDKGTNYLVINAGVPGYGLDQELLYLKNRGFKLKPEMVLINFCVCNDFLYDIQFTKIKVREGYLVFDDFKFSFLEKFRAFLIFNSHLYRFTERQLISIWGDFIHNNLRGPLQREQYQSELFLVHPSSKMKNRIAETEKLLDEINTLTKSNGIDMIISIIPLPQQVDNNMKTKFVGKYYKYGQNIDMEQPQNIIKHWGKKNDVEVIDLLPQMQKDNKNNDFFWKLNLHFNENGNKEVGFILSDYFDGLLP